MHAPPGGLGGRPVVHQNLGFRSCSPRLGLRCDVIARSRAADQAGALGSEQHRKTVERILRYPNGDTRRIRYPVADIEDEQEVDMSTEDLFWTTTGSSEELLEAEVGSTTDVKPKQTELPSSPAELIRYLNSEEYRQAQREQRKRIKASYQIMEGCPWVVSQSLYVVAVSQNESSDPLTYTLPTQVERKETARELSKVLKKGNIFDVGEVVDGVIAFKDPDDAERFRSNLEAEGHSEATLYEVDSHELFRNTRETKAVVVLMDCKDYSPFPLELGTSLRGHTSLEEEWRD